MDEIAQEGRFIAGDWGSSVMRLHLCARGSAAPLATVTGPGIKDCGDFEETFFAAAGPWLDRDGPMPIVLAGMIGSSLGWRDAAYVACPAGPADVAAAITRIAARGHTIAFAPGLSCTNRFGLPDVMRGEEMQVFGWMAAARPAPADARLLCLPGTHAKWVETRGHSVLRFLTSMQGELHDLLLRHSLIGRTIGAAAGAPTDLAAFDEGVAAIAAHPALAIEHAIFSVRSRVVIGGLPAERAASYLSGLLIGAEVRDGFGAAAAGATGGAPVVVIGAAGLSALYLRAFAALGIAAEGFTDAEASIRGIGALVPAAGLAAA